MQIRRRVFGAWLHDLKVGWGEHAYRSASAISPVLAAGQIGGLHTIGSSLAADGHSLDNVLAWFRLLALHSRTVRHQLEHGGVESLASGWADGVLHQEHSTTVVPFEVLRLRVQQQLAAAAQPDAAPGAHLALVVIDSVGNAECTARAARHARDTFHTGETIAASPTGKLLVLTHRDADLGRRTLSLIDALRHDDLLHSTQVRVWIEPLAMAAEHFDAHLLSLAS